MNLRFALAILISLLIVLFACWKILLVPINPTEPDSSKLEPLPEPSPTVLATIHPIADIARTLAGPEIAVHAILPPGASPHTFELSPREMANIEEADLIFAIGYGLDDWIVQATRADQLHLVDRNIALREVNQDEHEETNGEHAHGAIDPHYWLSGENGKTIAITIADQLRETYPQFATDIQMRLDAYLIELQSAHETTHTIINEVGNKRIVTMHDAWYYFADTYGLEIVGTYSPSAEKDPLPQDLNALADLIDTYQIQTLYTERQSSLTGLQAFIEDHNLLIAPLDELGGLEGTSRYIDLLLYNANVFASQP